MSGTLMTHGSFATSNHKMVYRVSALGAVTVLNEASGIRAYAGELAHRRFRAVRYSDVGQSAAGYSMVISG